MVNGTNLLESLTKDIGFGLICEQLRRFLQQNLLINMCLHARDVLCITY